MGDYQSLLTTHFREILMFFSTFSTSSFSVAASLGWPRLASVLAVAALTAAAPCFADGGADMSEAADTVWISLGEDAFETLQSRLDLGLHHQPLKAAARRGGVVATQVHRDDLLKISHLMHEAHRRCGGFLAHDSEAAALEALDGNRLPELKALPKAFSIDQGQAVRALVSTLQKDRIYDVMSTYSSRFNNRFYDHASGRNASTYLRNLWSDYARNRPDVTVRFREHAGWPQPSVIATIPGSRFPDEIVVLGGHLDSIAPGSFDPDFSAPGVDDNASGMAVLSELLRATLARGLRPDRTVQIMGYAAEEVGLQGSQEIARQYRREGRNVVAVLQLDMTAYQGSNEDIVMVSDFTNAELNAFVGRLVDTYQSNLRRTTTECGYGCSDHAAWTAEGFPATFPHEARVGQGNPFLHTTRDTLETIGNNADHAMKFAQLAAAFLVETSFVPGEAPTTPTDLVATANGDGTVDLQWQDASDNESAFEIEQRLGGTFEPIADTAADVPSWTVSGLPSGTAVTFRVRAINAGGASDYSNEAQATTAGEPPPTGLTAMALSGESVRLTWQDPSDGESGFRIEGHAGDGAFRVLADFPADAVEAVVEGLEPETTYTFRARTLGGLGDSTYSDLATATTFMGEPEPCIPGPSVLCLRNGRFKVQVDWVVGEELGQAKIVPGGSDDSGLLWFFSADNWEMLVKVLDGCSFNDHFWVFSAATTDLTFNLKVTDSWTGARMTYGSPGGQAAETVNDSRAFATCSAVEPTFP